MLHLQPSQVVVQQHWKTLNFFGSSSPNSLKPASAVGAIYVSKQAGIPFWEFFEVYDTTARLGIWDYDIGDTTAILGI